MTVSKDFKRDYDVFYKPVSAKDFKEYPKVIKNPKCIEDVIAGIRANRYDSCDAFLSDIMLISSNCETFVRSGHIVYNEELVVVGWALIVKVSGCFFKHFPAGIAQLNPRKWSAHQRALFKVYEIDYDTSDFILRVNTSNTAYYKVVKKPICLAEVQMHAASANSSADSVAERVKLLCSNCRMFCSISRGTDLDDLLLKVNRISAAFTNILELAAPAPAAPASAAAPTGATPTIFRIKSAASSAATAKSPALSSPAGTSPASSTAAHTPATFSSPPRAPPPAPAQPPGSVGYYVEQLAVKFPGFVPDVKLIMPESTYKKYRQIVKVPMSVSSMRAKLQQGAYSGMQFLEDVQTIGTNCITFWTGIDQQLVGDAHAFMKQVCSAHCCRLPFLSSSVHVSQK
jgi:hypothetical protein